MPGLLIDELVEVGLVTESQARTAREGQALLSTSQVMARLVELGLDERVLAGFFVSQGFGPMLQSAELARADLQLARRVRPKDAHRLCAMPLRPSAAGAIVAMADPTDEQAVAELRAILGGRILPTVAKLSDLRDSLERVYPQDVSTPVSDGDEVASSRLPSGVVPLVQEKPETADSRPDELIPPLTTDFASNASPVWDRAWNRSKTERDVSLTPKATRAPSQMPLPSLGTPSSAPPDEVSESELDAHLAVLGRAQSRDEAVERACETCAALSRGAAFLALRKGVFRGWAGAGEEVTTAAIRSLWVPASNPSTLNEVLHSGEPFRGAYGQTAADHLFRAAFGAQGHDVAIVPVLVGTRMVGVLCANDPRGETEDLERVATALGAAFERLIVARKTGD